MSRPDPAVLAQADQVRAFVRDLVTDKRAHNVECELPETCSGPKTVRLIRQGSRALLEQVVLVAINMLAEREKGDRR